MRKFVLLICVLLSGCGGSNSPDAGSDVRAVIEGQLTVLLAGIDNEDPILASQSISPLFEMGSNVALRYDEAGWTEDDINGISKFRTFFGKVFDKNANIDQQLEVLDFALLGDVATVTLDSEFSSVRVDKAPPENVSAAGTDVMVFERSEGRWQLVRWDESAG